jgi:hypothetical protein
MTEENYNKTMQNQRAMYAQSGIKSKADGYQLANQAYAEGRISELELVQSHQSLNMVFDNGSYGQAQKLMGGRNAGIAAVSGKAPAKDIDPGYSQSSPGFTPSRPVTPGDTSQRTPLQIKGMPAGIKPSKFTTRGVPMTAAPVQPAKKPTYSWMR